MPLGFKLNGVYCKSIPESFFADPKKELNAVIDNIKLKWVTTSSVFNMLEDVDTRKEGLSELGSVAISIHSGKGSKEGCFVSSSLFYTEDCAFTKVYSLNTSSRRRGW